MRSFATLVTVLVVVASGPTLTSAQQSGTLRIGSAAARAGEKGSGFIVVPAGIDSGTRIPLTIVRGKDPGPTLALIAGTHGDEVAPVIALQRVRRELDPARLSGTVLLVHVANLPSFLRRTIYYSPIDGKNLNRVYPGKRDGTVSERIADAITREIIERADYLVDIHAGDGNESLRPYTYWSPLGLNARADSIARQMALAWGNDYIVIDTARPRRAERDGDRSGDRLLRRHDGGHRGAVRRRHALCRRDAGHLRGRTPRHGRAPRGGAMRCIVPLVAGLLAASCHHAAKPGTAPARAETAVKVENQNYLDMDVFLVRGGQRIRLGMVTGLSTHLFMLRPEVVGTGTDLQFEFHPIGGRANPRTERIMVQPGDVIELTIPPS